MLPEQNFKLRPVSTGPRTAEGKARSSQNSLKHGLTAKQLVISEENQPEFDRLTAAVHDEYNPQGEIEHQITGEIVACTWRLARARFQEERVFASHHRELFVESKKVHRGFDRLVRYMGAIERQLNRSISRLQQLQSERRKLTDAPKSPAGSPKVMIAGSSNPLNRKDFAAAGQFVLSIPLAAPAGAPPAPPNLETPDELSPVNVSLRR